MALRLRLALFLIAAPWLGMSAGERPGDPAPVEKVIALPVTPVTLSKGSLHKAPYFGTKVRFEETARAAFARAQSEQKPVLLFHLSGDFSSSEKT